MREADDCVLSAEKDRFRPSFSESIATVSLFEICLSQTRGMHGQTSGHESGQAGKRCPIEQNTFEAAEPGDDSREGKRSAPSQLEMATADHPACALGRHGVSRLGGVSLGQRRGSDVFRLHHSLSTSTDFFADRLNSDRCAIDPERRSDVQGRTSRVPCERGRTRWGLPRFQPTNARCVEPRFSNRVRGQRYLRGLSGARWSLRHRRRYRVDGGAGAKEALLRTRRHVAGGRPLGARSATDAASAVRRGSALPNDLRVLALRDRAGRDFSGRFRLPRGHVCNHIRRGHFGSPRLQRAWGAGAKREGSGVLFGGAR